MADQSDYSIGLSYFCLNSIVAQATVISKESLSGYILYTMGNKSIFQEVMSHSNTVATR